MENDMNAFRSLFFSSPPPSSPSNYIWYYNVLFDSLGESYNEESEERHTVEQSEVQLEEEDEVQRIDLDHLKPPNYICYNNALFDFDSLSESYNKEDEVQRIDLDHLKPPNYICYSNALFDFDSLGESYNKESESSSLTIGQIETGKEKRRQTVQFSKPIVEEEEGKPVLPILLSSTEEIEDVEMFVTVHEAVKTEMPEALDKADDKLNKQEILMSSSEPTTGEEEDAEEAELKREALRAAPDAVSKQKRLTNAFDSGFFRLRKDGADLDSSQQDKSVKESNNMDLLHLSTTPVTSTVQTLELFKSSLNEYQLKGLQWTVNCYEQGLNDILADEMGLGKTIQAMDFLAHLAEEKNIWGPFLVVAPTSVLNNWADEFSRFCPDLKTLPNWGGLPERVILRKKHEPKASLPKQQPQSFNDAWRKLHSDHLLLICEREQKASTWQMGETKERGRNKRKREKQRKNKRKREKQKIKGKKRKRKKKENNPVMAMRRGKNKRKRKKVLAMRRGKNKRKRKKLEIARACSIPNSPFITRFGGDVLRNAFRWKETIGPWEDLSLERNYWTLGRPTWTL